MKRSSSHVAAEDVCTAIRKGVIRDMQAYFNKHAEARFGDSAPFLHIAADCGHKDILEFFLKHNYNVNAADRDNYYTPLHYSSAKGHTMIVQLLIEYNANIHAAEKFGRKPIHLAAQSGRKEVVEIFLNCGMDVNESNEVGFTSLHYASMKGRLELVKFLVDQQANLHAKALSGWLPIHVAASNGHENVVEYFLILGVDCNETDNFGFTCLHHAVEADMLKVVRFLVQNCKKDLLDVQDDKGKTALHLACQQGSMALMTCLLDAGARSDVKDSVGRTVVYYYMTYCLNRQRNWDIDILAKFDGFDCIDDREKKTAAHIAVKRFRDMDILKLVLQKQKDLNTEDIFGNSPLNYITEQNQSSSNSSEQAKRIRLFVENGAFLRKNDCQRINSGPTLQRELFRDKKFCTRSIVNKYNNRDLPMLDSLPTGMSSSILARLKLKKGQIDEIERIVEEEIRNEGFCDVTKMAFSLLTILSIESFISHHTVPIQNVDEGTVP